MNLKRAAATGLSVAVFAIALYVLHHAIGEFDLDEVLAEASGYRPRVLVASLMLVLASYAALSGFDWLALRHMRRDVPAGWTGLISFVSHAISHNAGFAALSGGAVRLRMYSVFGLGVREVAGVVAFAGLTFGLGAVALASAAFVAASDKASLLLGVPEGWIAAIGWGMAGLVCLYLLWLGLVRSPLAIWRWRLEPPTLGIGVAQVLVAAADLALVAGALHLLLPAGLPVSYPAFVGIYVMATLTGTLSHVPGGLGVFEGALLLLLPEMRSASILGALLVFRVFYNLVPLLLGAGMLGVFELMQRRAGPGQPLWLEALGPALSAALAFTGGVILLATGAVPTPPALPLWLAEPAHALSALAGVLLLISAHGLARQDARAHKMALAAMAAGMLLALMRGPDWVPALILASGAAILAAAAPLLRREGGGFEPLPWSWAGAAAAVVAGAWWLTLHSDLGAAQGLERLLRFQRADEGARALRGDLVASVALATAVLADRLRARQP